MTAPPKGWDGDIHAYLAQFDDIPGTRSTRPSGHGRAITSTSSP